MRKTLVTAVSVLGLTVSPLAVAGDNSVELRYGERGRITYAGAALRFGELWARESESGHWNMRLQPVFEGGRFRYSGGSRAAGDSLNYFGLGVGFRATYERMALNPYLEIGLGATVFDQTRLGPRSFSTRFQFTEWIGAGLELAEHVTLGVRFAHYSNANIKKPNDGLDMQQVVLGIRF
ncbi:MAG TPA: acyloxyacyl hydrolase [Azoarcus sp.]|nr:acyloxyacyl hydrolase [Azoarcus sp.]